MPRTTPNLIAIPWTTMLLALLVNAGCKQTQTVDTFAAEGPEDVDMLWIIDNSASMDDAQSQLRSSFNAFAEGLPPGSGTQLAITTTQAWPCTQDISSEGCDDVHGTTGMTTRNDFYPHYFDPSSNEQLSQFIELADVGIHGAGDERALQVALMAVCEAMVLPDASDFVEGVDDLRWDFPWGCSGNQWSPDDPLYEACRCLPQQADMQFGQTVQTTSLHGANGGMLRDNPLHIVIFSDEGDDTATYADLAGVCPGTPESEWCRCSHEALISLLRSVVPDVTISVFGPGQGLDADESDRFACNPQLSDECLMNYHFWSTERTGGSFFPIQTPVEGNEALCVKPAMSENLADLVLSHPSTEWFTLSRKPLVSSIQITVEDAPVPAMSDGSACSDAPLGGGGWAYDDGRSAISLTGDCTPYGGDTVTATYTPDDVEVQ